MNKKEDNFKEKFKQALISTAKVISDDYLVSVKNKNKNLSSKNLDFFELDNLTNKHEFVRLRAETDSEALKKKFSNNEIYKKNIPKKKSCKTLYDISEKIRYEVLGTKMLKGISKNFKENYSQKLKLKRKDQLKSKEDVTVSEAFELYMIKKFLNIELNELTNKMLSFWEKDFNSSIGKHLNFLNKNFENQEKYNSKFSKIISEMDIFDSNDSDEKNEDTEKNNEKNDVENQDDSNESSKEQKKTKQDENQIGIDGDYDFD